jgi:outer membrane receptor protein involved in Fe transport
MKNSLICATICWLFLMFGAASTAATLSGYVYDKSTDQPLTGATVAVKGTAYSTTTDSAGLFRFSSIAGGIYDLEITLAEYHPGFVRRLRLGSYQDFQTEVGLKPITAEERAKSPKPLFRNGKLTGKVTRRQDNEPVPGAVIKIHELAQGTSSATDGSYLLPQVKPGRYTVEAMLIGYKQVKNYSVEVYAGQETRLDFQLDQTVLPLGTEIVVYGKRPLLDPTTPSAIRSLEQQDIVQGVTRDLAEVLKELPGVVEIDRELHIRGGRTYETLYMVDGVSVSDPLIRRGYGLSLNTNAIRELNLYSGGADAEFAQATSGIVEITTKEGRENYTGSLNYKGDHLFGKSGFNSDLMEMTFSGPEPMTSKMVRSLGLPGETYFFWSGNFALSNTYLPYSRNLYSSTLGGSSLAPRSDNQYSTILKLSWKVTPLVKVSFSHSAAASINQDRSILETRIRTIDYSYGFPFEYSRNLDRYNTFTQKSNQQTLVADYNFSIDKQLRFTAARFFTTLHSDVRGQNWKEYQQPLDNLPDTVLLAPDSSYFTIVKGDGFYDSGDGDSWYDHYIENYSFKTTYETRIQENYSLKSGIETEQQTVQVLDIYKPWLGASGFGLNYDAYRAKPSTYGAFIQNHLNLEGMVFDFGLRYDLWFVGKYAEDALANDSISPLSAALRRQFNEQTSEVLGRRARGIISPRFGIANLISRSLTLFGSYSRFARKPSPQYLYAKLYTPSRSTYQMFGNPALDYEKVTNMEVGMKYVPNEKTALGISAYIKYIQDYIAATAVSPDPRFPDETYFLYFNLDYATSQGVELEFIRKPNDIFTFSANCSFSKARGERSLPGDILRGLKARSEGQIYNDVAFDWDKPWQFVLKTNFTLPADRKASLFGIPMPRDCNFNVKFWGQAGKRYTPYWQTTDTLGFVVFVPRGETNSKIGPWWNSLDMSFQKYFRTGKYTITLFLEGTNLLDHKNVTLINPLTGKEYRAGDTIPRGGNMFELPPLTYRLPLWENPTRFLNPRQIKFGLGVSF